MCWHLINAQREIKSRDAPERQRAAMHLINAVIATRMLIKTNNMVVLHPRRDLLLPFPLCWSVFFILFLGLGFRSD